jgi:plasmid segregation protein ParM
MTVLAIDIGYGFTKAMLPGQPAWMCLSTVGPAVDVRYEVDLGTEELGMTVKVDDRWYFVGKRALEQSTNARQTLAVTKVGGVEQKAQFYAAAGELMKTTVEEVAVITGLPVADYTPDKKRRLREMLLGHHVVERPRKWTREFKVTDVHVLPQGIGALYAMALDRRGQLSQANRDLFEGLVGIVDIGWLTTNLILTEELRYVEKGSNSIMAGIGRVLRGVGKDLKREYDLEWTLQLGRLDGAVRDREVEVYGDKVDISHLVEPHLEDVGGTIMAAAQSLPGWGGGAGLKAVVLTGGGSYLLGEYVRKVYPHTRSNSERPELDNVTGYLRAGVRRMR